MRDETAHLPEVGRPTHRFQNVDRLPLGAVGDLAAARSVARRLLVACGWDGSPACTFATMLVTALCLHASASAAADDVGLEDVTALLGSLLEDKLSDELRESPAQFVGYAIAELDALAAPERRSLLQALLLSLESLTARPTIRSTRPLSEKNPI